LGLTAARLFSCIDRIGPERCVFASEFPHEFAMEDGLDEINEILERKISTISTKP
jgi:predicted TIM-barrel fold metal-dependent hydrolase